MLRMKSLALAAILATSAGVASAEIYNCDTRNGTSFGSDFQIKLYSDGIQIVENPVYPYIPFTAPAWPDAIPWGSSSKTVNQNEYPTTFTITETPFYVSYEATTPGTIAKYPNKTEPTTKYENVALNKQSGNLIVKYNTTRDSDGQTINGHTATYTFACELTDDRRLH